MTSLKAGCRKYRPLWPLLIDVFGNLFHPGIVCRKGVQGQAAFGSPHPGGHVGFIPAAAHQTVAGHDPAEEKAVSLEGFLAVGRTGWTHLAPVAYRRGNDFLIKRNGK